MTLRCYIQLMIRSLYLILIYLYLWTYMTYDAFTLCFIKNRIIYINKLHLSELLSLLYSKVATTRKSIDKCIDNIVGLRIHRNNFKTHNVDRITRKIWNSDHI